MHTKVAIGRIDVDFPKDVIVEKLYVESQEKDTLLFGEKVTVNINLFKLLNNKVDINSVEFHGISANIKRDADSVFNYQFILKSFESPTKADSKPWKITVDKVDLDKIHFRFDDAITKNNL